MGDIILSEERMIHFLLNQPYAIHQEENANAYFKQHELGDQSKFQIHHQYVYEYDQCHSDKYCSNMVVIFWKEYHHSKQQKEYHER